MKAGPNISIGSPVYGPDFFDRKEIVKKCWDTLKNSSIILSSPRRCGASSVMLYLKENPMEEFYPIYFELEGENQSTDP